MDRTRSRHRALPHLFAIAVLAAVVATGIGSFANPGAVRASTSDTMEAQLLKLINDARAAKHLIPLRSWTTLNTMAGDRAATMARNQTLAHVSCLSCLYNSYGVSRYMAGEIIASSSYPWGSQAATSIFNGWKASSTHWSMLMSTSFNYIGLGVALGSNGRTYAAGELTESKDHSKPWLRMTSSSRSGSSVTWSWTGADLALQTHTAGLKNFDVQYRVGSGSWSTIKSGTTLRSLTLTGRASGHYYGLRVRARDNLGYVSYYTAEVRVWVP